MDGAVVVTQFAALQRVSNVAPLGGGSLNILVAGGAGIQGCAFAYSVQLLPQLARIPRIYGRDNALNVNYRTHAGSPRYS